MQFIYARYYQVNTALDHDMSALLRLLGSITQRVVHEAWKFVCGCTCLPKWGGKIIFCVDMISNCSLLAY